MPTTLSEVITARLDRVGRAKRVAQAAAVIGRSFDRQVLEAATGLEGPGLDAELRRLQEHALIEPSPRSDEMQFRHALIHEASYRSVLRGRPRSGCTARWARHWSHRVAPRRIRRSRPITWARPGRASRGGATVEAGLPHGARRTRASGRRPATSGRCWHCVAQLPEEERDATELKSRSRLVMCLTAVDQSAPEALEESRRVEELARRLGNREILLRNYMVLVPWWQASAEYKTINRILHEARTEAEVLGDDWMLATDQHLRGDDQDLAGHALRGVGAAPRLLRIERLPARRQPA